jgi:hypothetical protein
VKPIRMGDELALPIDAATQTFAFIARKGAGKTYAAGKLVEELIAAGVQVVILDTVGNWYGLRLASDGRATGFDVPVIGGLRGDIPLEATGGGLIADIVADTGRSLIIDVSQFSLGDRKRFATSFGEHLWKRKKGEARPTPLHVVIEESQLIVPQMGKGDDARMLGIYEEIIRLGRNYGIGVSMISQRPQSVNKEVLNQTECLFVGQVNGSQERDALKKWITHQGMDVHLVDELPTLPIGTFYVWSPQWLQILKKVKIGKKLTFDASATPKVGETRTRRELQPLDLDDLKSKMTATIERAKESDPRELKKQVVELKREIAKLNNSSIQAKAPTDEREIQRRIRIAVDDETRNLKQQLATRDERIRDLVKVTDENLRHIVKELGVKFSPGPAPKAQITMSRDHGPSKPATPEQAARAIAESRVPRTPQRSTVTIEPRSARYDSGANVGRGALRQIMIALAQHPEGLDYRKIGVFSGVSTKGGSFRTYLSTGRTSGWLDGDDKTKVKITDSGIGALGDYEPLPTGRDLCEYWIKYFGNSKPADILRALRDAWPNGLTDDEISAAANVSTAGGSYRTYLSALRTRDIIEDVSDTDDGRRTTRRRLVDDLAGRS